MDKVSLISILVIFLIILLQGKIKNSIKDNIYIQTFLILIITASVIREILFFKYDVESYTSIGVMFLGLGFALSRYIKKVIKKG